MAIRFYFSLSTSLQNVENSRMHGQGLRLRFERTIPLEITVNIVAAESYFRCNFEQTHWYLILNE